MREDGSRTSYDAVVIGAGTGVGVRFYVGEDARPVRAESYKSGASITGIEEAPLLLKLFSP
jgi:hypothetical protein